MFLREGRLIEARQQLDQAVASLADAPEIDQCKIMLNRGEVNGLIGDVAAAKADSARALELAQAYGLPTLAFYGTHNLGLFEFLSGNLPRALELMPSIEQASSDFERGVVGLDRARVLLSAGLVSEADRSLVEACTALSRTELVQFLAEAELIRAEVALLADNPELAQTVSSAAVARLRPRNNHRATALGELVKLRADAAAHTPGHQLVGVADRLTGVFSDLGLPDQARLARLIAIDYSMANAPALPRRLPTISPRSPSSCASTVGWSGPGWPSPAAIGCRGCARPAPECSNWPSTRPSSAAWTCRPPARSGESAWPPPRSPRRSRPTARPRCSPGWSGPGPSPAG